MIGKDSRLANSEILRLKGAILTHANEVEQAFKHRRERKKLTPKYVSKIYNDVVNLKESLYHLDTSRGLC